MTSSSEPTSMQEFIQRMLSPERAETLDTFVILSFCPVNVHDTGVEIGGGPGYFTEGIGDASNRPLLGEH